MLHKLLVEVNPHKHRGERKKHIGLAGKICAQTLSRIGLRDRRSSLGRILQHQIDTDPGGGCGLRSGCGGRKLGDRSLSSAGIGGIYSGEAALIVASPDQRLRISRRRR
jgi:hypothetical protein